MIKKLIRIITLIVHIMVIVWMSFSIIIGYKDTSSDSSLLSLLPYTLPFCIIINILMTLYWLLLTKKKWIGLIGIVCIIFTFNNTRSILGWNIAGGINSNVKNQEENNFKLMTYNVHLFDLGEWSKDKSTQRKLLDFIKEESPDILCLQEYYVDAKNSRQPFTEQIAKLGYTHFEFTEQRKMSKRFLTSNADKDEYLKVGIAIFSKYPISNKLDVTIDENSYYKCLSAEISLPSDKSFQLLTTHLQSFSLGNNEREFIEKVKDSTQLISDNKAKILKLANKMARNNSLRASQANSIAVLKKQSQLPLLVCGDMNDIPGSYVYNTLKENLSDPFDNKGWGFGRTFSEIFFTLRIDHIFYSDNFFKVKNYYVRKVEFSDHYPVIVNFDIL